MKNIVKFGTMCLVCVLAFSCKGFLDENPQTMLSETTAYSTEQSLEAQINGCIAPMNESGLWKGRMTEYLHVGSGLIIFKGKKSSDVSLDCLRFTKYSASSYGNKETWDCVFKGINRCNRLIDNISGSQVEDTYKTEIDAEARLLRAIYMFVGVRLWGDIPMLTTSPKTESEIYTSKTTYYRVYKQILDDLTYAENKMRDKGRQDEINFEKNRPNKWAATAFKASVYLTIGSLLSAPEGDQFWDSNKDKELIAAGKDPRTPDFKPCGISTAEDAFRLAYETAENVIENGPYRLVEDYRQLFRYKEHGDWFLPEEIFTLATSPQANATMCASWLLPQYPEGGNQTTDNANFGRARPSRFAIEMFLKYDGGYKGTGSVNKYIYVKTDDPRYTCAIRSSYINTSTGNLVTTYPENNSYVKSNSGDYCLPYYFKYLTPSYAVNPGDANYYVMRFAEMFLISAEAAAQLGKTPEAVSRINELRRRACMSNDSHTLNEDLWAKLQWSESTYPTKEELVRAVWWERHIEMCCEGHEFFDTHRYGATWLSNEIAKPMNEFLAYQPEGQDVPIHQKHADYSYTNKPDDAYVIYKPEDLRRSLVLPYPEAEMRENYALGEQVDFFWQ